MNMNQRRRMAPFVPVRALIKPRMLALAPRSSQVPTMDEFNALAAQVNAQGVQISDLSARVAALEHGSGGGGTSPVFEDRFTSLDVGTNGGSNKWRYCSWFSPDDMGYDENQSWMTNPLNPATPISGLYSADSNGLGLSVLRTPTQYINACDNLGLVSSQIVQQQGPFLAYGRWRARIAVKPIAGSAGAFWLVNENGVFPPGVNFEFCTGHGYPSFVNISVNHDTGTSGTQLWNFDISQYHTYEMEIRSDKITFSVDGSVAWSMPTPSPVGSPMMMILSNETSGLDWLGEFDSSLLPGSMTVSEVAVFA